LPLFLLALAAPSCGDGAPTAPTGAGFPTTVTAATALDQATGARYLAEAMAQTMNFGFPPWPSPGAAPASAARFPGGAAIPVPPSAAAIAAAAAEGCVVYERGRNLDGFVVDVNQNGIGDDYYLKIDCLRHDSTSSVDTLWVREFHRVIRVKEDFTALRAGTFLDDGISVDRSDRGDLRGLAVHTDGQLDIRPAGGAERDSFFLHSWSLTTGVKEDETEGEEWTAHFAPSVPLTAGTPIPDGALTFSGRRWTTSTFVPWVSFSIATTTPLAYTAVCTAAGTTPPFSGGTVTGRLNGRDDLAGFEVDFTSCGNAPQVTTHGTQGFKAVGGS
jgi:hypothetical protein